MTHARSWLRRGADAWSRFWFAPQPPHSLGIFRVLLGTFLLVYWLQRAPYVARDFSTAGIHGPMFAAPVGGFADIRDWTDILGWLTQAAPPWMAWSAYLALLVSLVLFTLGCWTFVANLGYLASYLYFYFVSPHLFGSSYDRLLLQLMVFMLLARSDAVFSLGARRWRRQGRPAVRAIPYWPARLICLQVTALYAGTGFTKLYSEAWQGGEVLYYALISGWASRLGFAIVQWLPGMWVYDVAVLGTILFELAAPVGLWSRRWQSWYFVAGFVFHLSIAMTLQIWQFLAIPAAYILFVDPSKVRDWSDKYSRRLEVT